MGQQRFNARTLINSNPLLASSCVIYLITNLITGKYYVGKCSRKLVVRWMEHLCCIGDREAYYLHRALELYGVEAFTVEILHHASCDEELKVFEKLWIRILRSYDNEIGYNLTMGGDGCIPSEATRKKMSDSHKTSPKARAHLEDVWNKVRGVSKTKEHCLNISEALKGMLKGPQPLAHRQASSLGLKAYYALLDSEEKKNRTSAMRLELARLRACGIINNGKTYAEIFGEERAAGEAKKRGEGIARWWARLSFEERSVEVKRRLAEGKKRKE